MESKNDDPNGCPDTVIGDCEAVCARCGRDMHPELERLRAPVDWPARLIAAAEVAEGEDWDLVADRLRAVASEMERWMEPEEVEAIGRALTGEDERPAANR